MKKKKQQNNKRFEVQVIFFYLQFSGRNISAGWMEKCQRTQIVDETVVEKISSIITAQLLPQTPKALTALFGFIAQ